MKAIDSDTSHFRFETNLVNKVYFQKKFTMPIRYILGLTSDCNLNCSFCFLQKPLVDRAMTLDDWKLVVDQIPENSRVILFGGEPFFYKYFKEIFTYVTKSLFCTVVTNGTLLSDSMIELLLSSNNLLDIAVSIDMVGNSNRGFTISQWKDLVTNLQNYKKRTYELNSPAKLGIAAVILDDTAEHLFELHQFAHEKLNCDYITYCTLNGTSMQLSDTMRQNFKDLYQYEEAPLYNKWKTIQNQFAQMQLYDRKHDLQSYLRPKLLEFSSDASLKILDELNQPFFTSDKYSPCTMPWSDCRIYSDGSVVSCLAYPFGNFKVLQDLQAILTSDRAEHFRNEIRKGFFPQCNRCVFLYNKQFA